MRKISLIDGSAALVIVAHPDDETIWMGGTILLFPRVHWTVFSLCRSSDSDRAPKFRRACERYSADAIISDLEDDGIMGVRVSVPQIKTRILSEIPMRRFRYVFTHHLNGEYGHPRHRGVALAVTELVRKREIITKSVFRFACHLDESQNAVVSDQAADAVLLLPRNIFMIKRDIITSTYGFDTSSFETRSCAARESFVVESPLI